MVKNVFDSLDKVKVPVTCVFGTRAVRGAETCSRWTARTLLSIPLNSPGYSERNTMTWETFKYALYSELTSRRVGQFPVDSKVAKVGLS